MRLTAREFNLPNTNLGRISNTTLAEHLTLYQGYIKNANTLSDKIATLQTNPSSSLYELGELYRRYSFEFNGARNHEHYFAQIEGGALPVNTDSIFYEQISKTFGSWDTWIESFALLAKTRGIGWAVLWLDPSNGQLVQSWVDEQHSGILSECLFVYGIDMWEHSYVHDYLSSGKTDYIADYIAHTNWQTVSNQFDDICAKL